MRVMCAPVALLSRATCAFGTTPPEGSLTEPRSDVSAVWPRSVSATTRIKPNDESFQFFIGDLLQTDLRKVTYGADCPRKGTNVSARFSWKNKERRRNRRECVVRTQEVIPCGVHRNRPAPRPASTSRPFTTVLPCCNNLTI